MGNDTDYEAIVASMKVAQNDGYIWRAPTKEKPSLNPDKPQCEKVSVITVCKNASKSIAGSINSVRAQSWSNIEYIIVDGVSTDGTLDIVRAATDVVSVILSAPDRGIAEAFNRGVALATGDYVAFCNADDLWEADHIARAVEALQGAPDRGLCYGDLIRYDEITKQSYQMTSSEDYSREMKIWPPEFNHPTFVCRMCTYKTVGGFDLRFRICMDFDWLFRAFASGISPLYLPGATVVMRCGGISDRQTKRMYEEVKEILLKNGVPATAANLRYGWRLFKVLVKSMLAKPLGLGGIGRVRHLINSSYTSISLNRVEDLETLISLRTDSRPGRR